MAKVEMRSESPVQSSGRNNSLFLYVLYFHIFTLYIIVYSLFNELQLAKHTLNDLNINLINLTTKEIQLQMKMLKDFSNQVCPEGVYNRRTKRETFQGNGSQFDSVRLKRKSGTSEEFLEHETFPANGTPDRKMHRERRGKKNKKKNRRKRGHGFVPRASHFIGAFPEPTVRDGGLLAPWVVANEAIKDFGLVTKVPSRSRDSIEIVETGLYFIYAQVYYMTTADQTKAHHSFMVMLKPNSGAERPLAHCATLGDSKTGGDASCYTAVAHSLLAGDVIYIRQRERDRHIIMRPGETFFGLVLLNKKSNG